ncbi:MAG: molybdopterin molybdenumtransferase MoeA [Alphaproteobacteria bacterium PRO2]|jgi:molybdopterin molybdotransferase|nr:molybdopterin molybdenumtransferase MoeA [Alphaproteobacteria bacterium PRO2]
MILYKEALEILRQQGSLKLLPDEWIDVRDIAGRINAEDIVSPIANQTFDNSAMDGFAVRTEDFKTEQEVVERIVAGDVRGYKPLSPGQCYEIMTGAALPPGCDAVIPIEKAQIKNGKILFKEVPRQGDNIRRAGEDFAMCEKVLEKGMELNASHVLALATLGIGKVKVIRKPKISFISTGQEVVDDLGSPLKAGQIYNSTAPYLQSALQRMQAGASSLGNVGDDSKLFKKKLQEGLDSHTDIIISTGAVSAGSEDFVPAALKDMGAETFFHKVAIRPGKPILFAKFPGSGSFFFGLPGNPVSTAAGLRFFVDPLIRSMQGLSAEQPRYAVLQKPFKKNHNLKFFVRARISTTEKASLTAHIQEKQQSFMVKPFTDTNAWAVIEENDLSLEAGDLVKIYQ